MKEAREYCMVLTTCPSREEGDRIAGLLVEGRLAACVQMADIRSCYLWKGAVNREAETLLIIKAAVPNYPAIESCILEHHSYEVPEVAMLPLSGGSAAYLAWIGEVSARSGS